MCRNRTRSGPVCLSLLAESFRTEFHFESKVSNQTISHCPDHLVTVRNRFNKQSSKMANVSPAFIWLATKDTDCALLRRPNGVGDLSTCAYNPVGTQRPRNSAFANQKHAGVVAHPSGEGFVLNHQGKRNANKPAKCFTSQQLSNLKSADVLNFRNFVQYRLGRKDLSAVSSLNSVLSRALPD